MSSSSPKQRHYWLQLPRALVAGQWLAEYPAKTQKAELLSWSDLFRKFRKHCGGEERVCEVASQTFALAVVLATTSLNEDEDYGARDFSVELGEECVLPPERIDEAFQGYEALKALSPGEDVNHALAYYAYAIGRPEECIRLTDQVVYTPKDAWELTLLLRSLCLRGMAYEKLHPEDPREALKIYGDSFPAFKILSTSAEFKELVKPPVKGSSGKLDFGTFVAYRELWRWVERLVWRAVCLSARVEDVFGSQEEENALWLWLEKYTIVGSSWPPNFRAAHRCTVLSVYLRCVILRISVPSSPPLPTALPNTNNKNKRQSVLSATSRTSRSSRVSRREQERERELWMYSLPSLVAEYKTVLGVCTSFPRAGERNAKVEEFVDLVVGVWEALAVSGAGRKAVPGLVGAGWVVDTLWWATRLTFNSSRVLRHMVKFFYLAGDGNASTKDKGEGGDVELARRAVRLYVNVVGKAWVAKRQGAAGGVDSSGGSSPVDGDGPSRRGETNGEGEEIHGEGYYEDTDTDENWVKTLVYGARMLCREAARRGQGRGVASGAGGGGREPLEMALEARGLVGRARERVPPEASEESRTWKRLRAELELAEGICGGVVAVLGENPDERDALLERAHECLVNCVRIWPGESERDQTGEDVEGKGTWGTEQAYFHLSLSYLRRRELESAVECAAKALERATAGSEAVGVGLVGGVSNTSEGWDGRVDGGREGGRKLVRYWHLLGLVLSALEKWSEAEEVLLRGEVVGEEGEDEGDEDEEGESESEKDETELKQGKQEEGDGGQVKRPRITAIPPNAKSVPPISKSYTLTSTISGEDGLSTVLLERIYNPLSRPFGELFPGTPSAVNGREDGFEEALQVRMTRMSVVEVREGGEGAERGWVDVFGWVARWRGVGAGSSTGSVGAGGEGPVLVTAGAAGAAAGGASTRPRRHSFEAQNENRLTLAMNMSQVSVTALNATTVRTSGGAGVTNARASVSSGTGTANGEGVEDEDEEGVLDIPIPITISPASPDQAAFSHTGKKTSRSSLNSSLKRRSSSIERTTSGGGDTSKSKKMQQKLKNQVHKSQARISAVGKKIGHGVGVVSGGASGLGANLAAMNLNLNARGMRRTNSAPDLKRVLQGSSAGGVYQASSIHSRKRIVGGNGGGNGGAPSVYEGAGGSANTVNGWGTPVEGSATPVPGLAPPIGGSVFSGVGGSVAGVGGIAGGIGGGGGGKRQRENRLLSDLWAKSAATFRRLGKAEQARGAIQDAEVRDEANTGVWVQLALYYVALGHHHHAISTLQKALFIDPDDVSTIVHLARLYLSPPPTSVSPYHRGQHAVSRPQSRAKAREPNGTSGVSGSTASGEGEAGKNQDQEQDQGGLGVGTVLPSSADVDLACGLLTQSSKGRGWDVPEVWFYLAKAYGYQGRKEKEMEALRKALYFAEGRPVRDVGEAIGLCI